MQKRYLCTDIRIYAVEETAVYGFRLQNRGIMNTVYRKLAMAALLCGAATMNAQKTNSTDTLSMERIVQELPDVLVKGSRPAVKAERGMLTYNMPVLLEKLPADNAYEALMHLPGVSEVDGSVKFSGGSVTLIINGQSTTLTQEQLAERLKALPAAQLAKAEVMLSAPARYHVRGMAINIVTKDYAGTNHVSGQLIGGWRQSRYGVGSGEGYLTVQRGKFGLDAQYGLDDGNTYRCNSFDANHPLGDKRVAYSSKTRTKYFDADNNYRVDMNYAFAKDHRLGVAYTGEWEKTSTDVRTTGSDVSEAGYDGHTYLHNVDVNYSLPFGLSLDGSFTYYRSPGQNTLDGTLDTGDAGADSERDLVSLSRQTITKWMFTADQTHSLAHGWGLSYGAKAQFSNNNSYQTTRDEDGNVLPDATSSVDVNERIWSVYGGFSKQINEAVSLEASVEAEQYHSPVWDKWRIYPTVNALWNINDDHVLNLSFSSNSTFPDYWAIMSSVMYASMYTEQWGNPNLMPCSDYNVSLMWQMKRRYTLTLSADLQPDYFTQLPYQTSDRMAVILKEINFDYNRTVMLNASAMFSAGKWLNGNVFAAGAYRHDKSSHFFDLPFDRRKLTAILGGTASIKLCRTQDLSLVLNPFFQSEALQGVYDIEPIFRVNATLRWNSKDGKWGLRVNGRNILNDKTKTRSVQGNQDFRMTVGQNWASVSLTAIYKFGGYKEKRVKEVDTSRMGH